MKVRSFMYHAGFLNDDGGWDSRPIHEQEDNFKRFAELIVRECAKVAFNDWCEGTNEESSQMAILKHFGVEEGA